MEIILALLLASVLIAFAYPQFIRSRAHFTLAAAGAIVALLCYTLAALPVIGFGFACLTRLAASATFAMIVCAAGGYTFRGLWREVTTSFRSL